MRIDNNLKLTELDPMHVPRYNVPVTFVNERFICALGGQKSANQATSDCEVFDIVKSKWLKIQPMP